MFDDMLKNRGIPPLLSREKMLDILQKEEYGYLPPKPDGLSWEQEVMLPDFCAGKACLKKVLLTCRMNGKDFTYPVYAAIPKSEGKHPFFIHINFRDSVPDRYMPTEELIDNGFAVISFGYKDVTADNGDFTSGLAGILYDNGKRADTDAGKLAIWAWAAQRALDYAESEDSLDKNRAVVCGHSRLGKTALLAAATDNRFAFAYSNDSGCSGAAVSREKKGETVENICDVFPYWFCRNFSKYKNNEQSMPFDQHYLIASIAPRYVCVGSSEEDKWADPPSEMLSCAAAGPVYEQYGMAGFVSDDRLPEVGDKFFEGSIGYHLRAGTHYFSREDWLRLIEFIKLKKI